ncbi:MAG: hypothetical protein KAW88_09090, partial [Candidatus Cloacimonetes bacterium]|nr:hypothetical protein [Candidatus Cloacimonadota bacterium]
STGNPTTWQWDFQNDGTIDSYVQNPVWIYTETGIYTVSLTVSDGTNTDTEIKTDYITVSGGPALEPPTSLSVTILGYATWDSPSGGATGILAHHNGYDGIGVGTGSTASWISAARFDATDLATYYGSNLTEVNIHIRSTDFSYVEARVYEGGSFGDPGTLIYAQDITSFVLIEDWTNHVLTTPIPLVAGNEYWIGYYMDATGDHPASVDAGPAVPGKGDWMFYSGAWVEISTEYGIDKNWCIEGVVGVTDYIRDKVISTKNISSQPPGSMVTLGIPKAAFNHPKQRYDRASDTRALLGYKVYLDGEYVDFTTNLFWQYTGLTSGVTYTAGVSALYDEGESNIIEEPFTYSDTIYVKQDGTGDVTTIQAGIDIAQNGNVVLVYQGTYIENINFNGKNITVGSLFLTTLDTTYISQTIINGNHSGRVVSINSGEDLTALLTGFTITNGYASGDWPNDLGAGIFIDNSSPTISYCIISGNSADGCGAGITWLGLSSPIISNCTISWNSAPNSVAGGILCQSSEMANPPSIENCTIENNSALSGAGVYLRD